MTFLFFIHAAPSGLPRPVINAYPAAVGVVPLQVVVGGALLVPDLQDLQPPHHRADQDEHRDRGDDRRRRGVLVTPKAPSLRLGRISLSR